MKAPRENTPRSDSFTMPISTKSISENYWRATRLWCAVLLVLAISTEVANYLIFGSTLLSDLFLSRGVGESAEQVCLVLAGISLFLLISGIHPLSRKENIVLLIVGIALAAWIWKHPYGGESFIIYLPIPYGLWSILTVVFHGAIRRGPPPERLVKFVAMTIFWLIFIGVLTLGALHINTILYPTVYDEFFYKIDAAFSFSGGKGWAAGAFDLRNAAPAWIQIATVTTYAALAWLFGPLIALLIRDKKLLLLHGWRTMLIPFILTWLWYTWLPGVGPTVAFYEPYKNHLPNPADVASVLAAAPPSFRNAMPSMHLFGTLLILIIATGL